MASRGALWLAAVTSAVTAAAPHAVAEAATVSRVDAGAGPVITYQASGSNVDRVTLGYDVGNGATYSFYAEAGGDSLTAGVGCTAISSYVDCPAIGTVSIRILLLGGDDRAALVIAQVPVRVEGGDGADEATGGAAADVILGEGGGDTLRGGLAADRLLGGEGADRFLAVDAGDQVQGEGGDDTIESLLGSASGADISGGQGTDTLIAATPDNAARQEITLDDVANDIVAAGIGINVHMDVESVTASAGDDKLTGSPHANRLDGGAGVDTIVGGAGSDTIVGGTGDDVVDAQDGVVDTIDCGAGNDRAQVDSTDVVIGCEVAFEDGDRDGAAKGPDCNDADPAIHPGAIDVPDNGIDEDCSGTDTVNRDRDHDGFERPLDCNDADPAIHPGVPERRGNAVDEDCDGLALPFLRITSGVRNVFVAFARFTVVKLLVVRDAPVGAIAQVGCRGRGCPRKPKRLRSTGARELYFTGYLAGRLLRPGAVVEVRITLRDRIGKVVRYQMRAGRSPRATVLCLPPGQSKPSACAPG